jgi:hypothetical protein
MGGQHICRTCHRPQPFDTRALARKLQDVAQLHLHNYRKYPLLQLGPLV